mmetsp:Transcript_8517/g.35540  ORF Transcript_8517/g.35540 Transcript_8517/m.35540 type:complete len:171 (-) Transcript_8517:79-591(-)|eukprot:CAMPEP_0114612360 /NCGR_PEP_ID=MMETSP0168-20121206/4582_1 /TAXON_ID=95228 ORGANISM="Vannella sp., Strain DIVA3 517/6/12" /NCGR_SAMPLE_ID=MMETSP0168 /ASSEMBLY_ACC=CAM_ASM_000044 /LENGTH=170 /DNA_ID=CAMNT_0001823343 /DNA_START=204 /DNA_END=716 /DNA_ORIENTATION=+
MTIARSQPLSRTEYGSVKRRYLAALGFRPDANNTPLQGQAARAPLEGLASHPPAPLEGTPPCPIPLRKNTSQNSLRTSMECCFLMDEEELDEPTEELPPISQSCPIAVPEFSSNWDRDGDEGQTIGIGMLTSDAWDSEEDFIPPHLLVNHDSTFSVYEFRRKKKATEHAL